MGENTNDVVVGGPVGVGGWLLLFCLGLTVFTPLYFLTSITSDYEKISALFVRFPGFGIVYNLSIVINIGISLFAIYAGAGLWRKKAGAVALTKLFLKVFLAANVITLILPFFAGLPSQANEAMAAEVVKVGIRPVLYFLIWTAYLNKSLRVKNTYPQP